MSSREPMTFAKLYQPKSEAGVQTGGLGQTGRISRNEDKYSEDKDFRPKRSGGSQ